MSASIRSSTAMPGEPCVSKNADCGLNTGTRSPSASTMVAGAALQAAGVHGQAPRRQQGGVRVDPDAQRAAVGDQRGPVGLRTRSSWCSSSTARRSASATVQIGDQAGSGVDEAGVELQQAGAGVEHRLAVVGGHDAADPDHRQVGAGGQEADHLAGPDGQRSTGQSAGLGGPRPPRAGSSPSRDRVVLVAISPAAPAARRNVERPARAPRRSGRGRA